MKKHLLTLLCLLCLGLPALAATETLVMSQQGWTNGQDLSQQTIDAKSCDVSFKQNSGSNPPKYYNSGTEVRLYAGSNKGCSFTVTQKKGVTISKVTFKKSSTATATDVTGSNGVYTFQNTTTSHVKVYSITVEYTQASTNTSDAPEISGTTPFEESTLVTITAAEGASIYYTLDNTDPTTSSTPYNAPFTLTETTTVKAIAVEEGKDPSEVVTANFKKKAAALTSNKFKKITSTADLEEGALYVLAYVSGATKKAMSTAESADKRLATDVEVEGDVLTANDNTLLIQLVKDGNNWKLFADNYLGDNKYFSCTSKTEITMATANSASSYGISFSNQGNVQIGFTLSSTARTIKWNGTADFRFYADSNGYVIQMYKQYDAPQKEAVTLTWDEKLEAEYTEGSSEFYTLTATPTDAAQYLTLTSSDPEVADVEYDATEGMFSIDCKKAGAVTLTAALNANDKYEMTPVTKTITVKAKPVSEKTPVTLTWDADNKYEFTVEENASIYVTVEPAAAAQYVTATSNSDAVVAQAEGDQELGLVSIDLNCVKAGTVTLTVSLTDNETYEMTPVTKTITVKAKDPIVTPDPDEPTDVEEIVATFDFTKSKMWNSTYDYAINETDAAHAISNDGELTADIYVSYGNYTDKITYVDNKGWNLTADVEEPLYHLYMNASAIANEEGVIPDIKKVVFSTEMKMGSLTISETTDGEDVLTNTKEGDVTTSTWKATTDNNTYLMFDINPVYDFTLRSIDVTYTIPAIPVPTLYRSDDMTLAAFGWPDNPNATHHVYYRIEKASAPAAAPKRAATGAEEGYTKFDGKPFAISAGDTVHFYAAHPNSGRRSAHTSTTIDEKVVTAVNGIEVDAEQGAVRYFNLQGVEVSNPANGIFIRVANGKSEKVVL